MNKILLEAIRSVGEELRKLSKSEFRAELAKHRDGDISNTLLELNTLGVGEI